MAAAINKKFTCEYDFQVVDAWSPPGCTNRTTVRLKKGDTGFVYKVADGMLQVRMDKIPVRTDPRRLFIPPNLAKAGSRAFTSEEYRNHRVRTAVPGTIGNQNAPAGSAGEVLNFVDDGRMVVILWPDFGNSISTVPFYVVDISDERRITFENTIHRRFTLRNDHVFDNGITVSAGGYGIITGIDIPASGTGSVHIRPAGRTTTLKVPWDKGDIDIAIRLDDVKNRTFKIARPVKITVDANNVFTLKPDLAAHGGHPALPGDVGIINGGELNNNTREPKFKLRVKTQGDIALNVPHKYVTLGVKVGEPYKIVYDLPEMRTRSVQTGTNAPNTTPFTGFRAFIETFLDLTDVNKSFFPDMPRSSLNIIETPTTRRTLAQATWDGMTPALRAVFGQPSWTVEDIVRACPAAGHGSGNRRGGVYLRVLWGFEKGSPFEGQIYVYVGQTVVFVHRDGTHKSGAETASTKGTATEYQRVLLACQQLRVVQLFAHPEEANVRDDEDVVAARHVIEQVFHVIIASYLDEHYATADTLAAGTEDMQLETVATAFDYVQLAKLFTKLAAKAFRMTGFGSGRRPQSSIGPVHGCNKSSPIMVHAGHREDETPATVWVRTEGPDRYYYRRSPMPATQPAIDVAGKEQSLQVLYIFGKAFGGKTGFVVRTPPDSDSDLVAGTMIYPVIEMMKNGKSHEVPHFQLPDCGSWTNWNDEVTLGNSFGLRARWYSKKKASWCERWIQVFDTRYSTIYKPPFVSDDPGSYQPYVDAMALYAHLTISRWTQPPTFYKVLNTPRMVHATFDHFMQTIHLTLVISPIRPLEKPEYDVQVAANYMHRTLGLDNVAGSWQSLETSQDVADADPAYNSLKLARPNNGDKFAKNFTSNRHHCDCCLLRLRASFTIPGSSDLQRLCAKDPRFQHTYISNVLGDAWDSQIIEHGASAHRDSTTIPQKEWKEKLTWGPVTDRAKELWKALVSQPFNKRACTTQLIADPKFVEIPDPLTW
ncbi:hypothetical protein LTR17_008582 [Elasticomyces elasticus]|nr:hypothetical protein LTR17_008582 [Elasticomyces elasticus]